MDLVNFVHPVYCGVDCGCHAAPFVDRSSYQLRGDNAAGGAASSRVRQRPLIFRRRIVLLCWLNCRDGTCDSDVLASLFDLWSSLSA